MAASLPLFLAGPILRRTTASQICFWAITSEPLIGHLFLYQDAIEIAQFDLSEMMQIQLGEHCFLVLIDCQSQTGYPTDTKLEYDFVLNGKSQLSELSGFLYPDAMKPYFCVPTRADHIVHGSCRHPHFHSSKHEKGRDALVALDKKYETLPLESRADLFIMTGDQIYADDVCGPLMFAIQQTRKLLGLFDQVFDHAPFYNVNSEAFNEIPLYGRSSILPHSSLNHGWFKKLFKIKPDPIFSSHTTENHLISFSEFISMYILVWSPEIWECIELPEMIPNTNAIHHQDRWHLERKSLLEFIEGLPAVRRLLAHIPTYMILDDHDVTDDFNLTVGWEKAVFNSPFAQSIITNAMLAYFCCQGWGNHPNAFDQEFLETVHRFIAEQTPQNSVQLNALFHHFEQWHYTIPTNPIVVVIDTRTRRWRSESNDHQPSGLMDWESLMDFQNDIFNHDAVVVVSPAPMFGMKFIETVQRIVTFLGHPLLTDSENWMAHPGSASALLNIFKHPKTPKNFVILSGDVHYSFAYDIRLRFRKGSPKIWQITCSGFRNQFPEPLLSCLEWFDRKLFWPESPLNFFTRRKRMRIERRLTNTNSKQLCLNESAVGEVILNQDGSPRYIGVLTGNGQQIEFIESEKSAEIEADGQAEWRQPKKGSN